MYILDANAFIEASKEWYPFSSCPEYWNWLVQSEQQGILISIKAIKDQIFWEDTKDQKILVDWCNTNEELFKPTTYKDCHSDIVEQWVTNPRRPYTENAIGVFLNNPDSDLITEALARSGSVVTYELSEPYRQKKVKIPDVCTGLGIECIKPHDMLRREGMQLP